MPMFFRSLAIVSFRVADGWIHAGLGDAAGAEVRVQWPDGEAELYRAVERCRAQRRISPNSPSS